MSCMALVWVFFMKRWVRRNLLDSVRAAAAATTLWEGGAEAITADCERRATSSDDAE